MTKIPETIDVDNEELISFAQSLVQIQSYSGKEEKVIRAVEARMRQLGYDEVSLDSMGNLLGRIGNGPKTIMFDSHLDTVEVKDERNWDYPPFDGIIAAGSLHGRGSVDMKSAAAASVYAAANAKMMGWLEDKTVYVSCTVFEEDCDGENLKHLFKERNLEPGFVVICEPSNNLITLGHKGKAQISIKTQGVSAHGSAPEKGHNAIYEMAEIIQRVENLNNELMKKEGMHGTVVMSRISSLSASLNAVPSECEVYLDRRLVPGETREQVIQEMDGLVAGKKATWQVGTLVRNSWTGMQIVYEPFHLAWKIELDHALAQAAISAYEQCYGVEPSKFDYWDFSTNAVTPVSMGIPCIGFGPGEYKLAHMVNENCKVHQIIEACNFYALLIKHI